MAGRFPTTTWPSIPRRGGLDPWPVGKVALSLRPGQAGAQPRGAGRSAGPGVHGPREPGASAALRATGLFLLQAHRLRLEALSPAPETPERSFESGPFHPPHYQNLSARLWASGTTIPRKLHGNAFGSVNGGGSVGGVSCALIGRERSRQGPTTKARLVCACRPLSCGWWRQPR